MKTPLIRLKLSPIIFSNMSSN